MEEYNLENKEDSGVNLFPAAALVGLLAVLGAAKGLSPNQQINKATTNKSYTNNSSDIVTIPAKATTPSVDKAKSIKPKIRIKTTSSIAKKPQTVVSERSIDSQEAKAQELLANTVADIQEKDLAQKLADIDEQESQAVSQLFADAFSGGNTIDVPPVSEKDKAAIQNAAIALNNAASSAAFPEELTSNYQRAVHDNDRKFMRENFQGSMDVSDESMNELAEGVGVINPITMTTSDAGSYLLHNSETGSWLYPSIRTINNYKNASETERKLYLGNGRGVYRLVPDKVNVAQLTRPALLRQNKGRWEVAEMGVISYPHGT